MSSDVSTRPFPALLAGLRILDASRVLAGPFCGQMLGDLGAEVIKIERPGVGDETRTWGPPFLPSGVSAYYLSCNRNKRGLCLDMSRPRGQELFARLVAQSDVVLENYLPDSAKKLGLDPETLLQHNPRIIVCSISGFGRTGPWRDLPGYDFAIQALSGLMSITGPRDGEPCKVGVAVADILTGMHAITAILACLIARGRTGHGYVIDLALLDCALASQVNVAQAYLARRQAGLSAAEAVPPRQGNSHLQIVPYQLFATRDGWLVLAVGNDSQWQRFCQAVAPTLGTEERYRTNPGRVQHRDELLSLLEALLRTHSTAEWVAILERAGVPCAPLWSYADLFAHPQADARGLRVTVRDPDGRPVDLVGSPFHIREGTSTGAEPSARPDAHCPPAPGQHTAEILAQLCNVDPSELDHLRTEGVIG